MKQKYCVFILSITIALTPLAANGQAPAAAPPDAAQLRPTESSIAQWNKNGRWQSV